MSGDYGQWPASIGELRSDRTQSCKDWTPRDLLVATLRMIDSGELATDDMVLLYVEKGPAHQLRMGQATPRGGMFTMAMLAQALHDLADRGSS